MICKRHFGTDEYGVLEMNIVFLILFGMLGFVSCAYMITFMISKSYHFVTIECTPDWSICRLYNYLQFVFGQILLELHV